MAIAFLFPGQGAQYVGMGRELYEQFDIVRTIFNQGNEILGEDLAGLCFEGPAEELTKTENTQPGILMVSTAISALLRQRGLQPVMAAGLSLGEYGALVAAGALSFEDALPLVRKRGRFMQQAVPLGKGTMAAILGLDAAQVNQCCQQASDHGVVEVANYNCPGQLVISGEVPAVERACALAKEAGAKRAMQLQVSGPFHSSLLKPAGDALAAELDTIRVQPPQIPVISNVEAAPVQEAEEVKRLLIAQVSHSVRWEDSIRYMLSQGIDTFVEMGPGKVLTGFLKKITKDAVVYNVEDAATLEAALAGLEGVR